MRLILLERLNMMNQENKYLILHNIGSFFEPFGRTIKKLRQLHVIVFEYNERDFGEEF